MTIIDELSSIIDRCEDDSYIQIRKDLIKLRHRLLYSQECHGCGPHPKEGTNDDR